jgi:hypothetical protein
MTIINMDYFYDCDDFEELSDNEINETIFNLNNNMHKIYDKIVQFKPNCCSQYYFIEFVKQSLLGKYEYFNARLNGFSSQLERNDIRFIFIKLNLYDISMLKYLHLDHNTGLIIDKQEKLIIHYDPRNYYTFERSDFKFLEHPSMRDYKFHNTDFLGFSIYERLQWTDNFCQTYVMIIMIIIMSSINYDEAIHHIKSVDYDVISRFLFKINKLIDRGNDTLVIGKHWFIPKTRIQSYFYPIVRYLSASH